MQKQIAQSYAVFAQERGDDTFELRFNLAKARALIRVAKGRAKRNELYLQTNGASHNENSAMLSW
jgi:hypothetical protein